MKRRALLWCTACCLIISVLPLAISFFFSAGANYLGKHGGPVVSLYPGVVYLSILQTYPNVIVEQGLHANARLRSGSIRFAQIPKIPWVSKNAQGTIDFILPLWIPVLILGFLQWALWRSRRAVDLTRCLKCNHDLSGIRTSCCPECGSPINNPPACASSTSPHA